MDVNEETSVNLKVFMGGWYGSGKTTWVETLRRNAFPDWEYRPTVVEALVVERTVEGTRFNLSLWDWYVQVWDAASKLVGLGFPGTDVCLLNYSVVCDDRKRSLVMLEDYWVPEVRKASPKCVFLLHAMQVDQRAKAKDAVTKEEGEAIASRLGGIPYVESSALTGFGMTEVLDAACKEWLRKQQIISPPQQQQQQRCQLQ